ncbi:MAG: DEAD/DEAH box helicase [Legionella sp.]|nr:DEAD/DEAH box helicase [Legionella sp.]
MLKDALSRMADVFAPTVLMQGQEYQQKGYVLNIRLSDGLLKARVKGRSSQIHDVHIDLKSWPGRPARCNCQHSNCKHAAASLFAMQVRENVSLPAPSSQSSGQSLTTWLQSLQEKRLLETHEEMTHQIVYLLEPQAGLHEHRVLVRLALAKRLKRGGLGKKIIFNTITASRKQFFTDNDEEIIAALLFKCGVNGWFERLAIRNSDLIEKILLTKRAFLFDSAEEPALGLGEPVEAQLQWHLERDGTQRLVLEACEEALTPLFLDKAWYYDKTTDILGFLTTPYQAGQLKTFLTAPPVALDEVAFIASSMATTAPELPRPQLYEQRRIAHITPVPVIYFNASPLEDNASQSGEDFDFSTAFLFSLTIAFEYDGLQVDARDPTDYLFYGEGETLVEIKRDRFFEDNKQNECLQILPVRAATIQEKLNSSEDLRNVDVLMHYRYQEDLARLHNQVIPVLKNKGWRVEFNHSVFAEVLTAEDIEWFSELREKGHDFFAYQLGILVEGKQVSIVPLVADLITKLNHSNIDELPDETMVSLALPDGKRLQVNMGRIKPLIRFLLQYGTKLIDGEPALQINRYQLILMQETEQAIAATAMRWRGGELLRQQMQQLIAKPGFDAVEIPQGLQTTLRDYQHEGLNWIQFLRKSRLGGVLADDMGLGKTVQTLAHLQYEKEQGRLTRATLIVAPTSLVGNWYEEAMRFTPQLKILIFHGLERHQDEFDNYDVVISTYGLIQRDKSRFVDYQFYYLILDEAQFIKNARAKTTQIIQQINAEHRLCLSGTPLENHLGELWSLFHFLMPGLLGDVKQFRKFFKTPIEKNSDNERQTLLANRVRPFMLRRTKNQVESELPAKTEMTRMIELDGTQRDLYEAIRMSMEKKVRDAIARQGMGKSHIVLLDALLKLRQVCCDPRLLSIPEAQIAHGTSAKLDALMDLIDNLVAEKRRVLVFSQFTSMLKLIEEELKNRQYEYLKLTGQTQNRQQLVNKFQNGDTPVFLISLKAGGTGLNLTKADTVIHYDPWWNPAAEDQATDRSHRIGQENPVFVYKLITAGTVEEAILAMQDKKRQLFDGILSENIKSVTALTDSDIEKFFMPLVE